MAEEKAEKVHRYERTYGAFERTFRLSASIDPNKIKATYNLGVLTITLPKAETAKPHLIKVRSEEHTSELQSPCNLVCRLLLEKKNRHLAEKQKTRLVASY